MDEERFDLKTKILAGVVIGLILLLCAFGLYIWLSGGSKVKVPNFAGQTKEQVQTWAKDNKISDKKVEFKYEYDDRVPVDVVIAQDPKAGKKLKKNTLVITLSQGADPESEIELPTLANLTREEAEAWFNDNGFTNVVYETLESSLPDGTVISVTPAEGQSVKRSASVTVVIASNKTAGTPQPEGNTDGTVPDFSTYTRQDVANWGANNGVKVIFNEEASNKAPKGGVVRQNPAAGTPISAGGTVTVSISGGPPVTLVNQVGKPKADADKWTTENNLKPVYIEVYGNQPKGSIEYMLPAQGIVWETAEIQYGVSVGQPVIKNFTDLTEDEANAFFAELNAAYSGTAKINYVKTYKDYGKPVGTVLTQNLNGTAQYETKSASPGSTVELLISSGITVPSYEGVTEAEFLNALNTLGVTPGTRSEDYSDTVPVGCIIWNESGPTNSTAPVNYTVSLGSMYATEAPAEEGTQG